MLGAQLFRREVEHRDRASQDGASRQDARQVTDVGDVIDPLLEQRVSRGLAAGIRRGRSQAPYGRARSGRHSCASCRSCRRGDSATGFGLQVAHSPSRNPWIHSSLTRNLPCRRRRPGSATRTHPRLRGLAAGSSYCRTAGMWRTRNPPQPKELGCRDGTTSGGSGAIPAGWYPDPAGGDGKRWWDGSLDRPAAAARAAAAPALVRQLRYPADRSVAPLPTVEPGIAYTRTSWWLAFSPLWIVVPVLRGRGLDVSRRRRCRHSFSASWWSTLLVLA